MRRENVHQELQEARRRKVKRKEKEEAADVEVAAVEPVVVVVLKAKAVNAQPEVVTVVKTMNVHVAEVVVAEPVVVTEVKEVVREAVNVVATEELIASKVLDAREVVVPHVVATAETIMRMRLQEPAEVELVAVTETVTITKKTEDHKEVAVKVVIVMVDTVNNKRDVSQLFGTNHPVVVKTITKVMTTDQDAPEALDQPNQVVSAPSAEPSDTSMRTMTEDQNAMSVVVVITVVKAVATVITTKIVDVVVMTTDAAVVKKVPVSPEVDTVVAERTEAMKADAHSQEETMMTAVKEVNAPPEELVVESVAVSAEFVEE